MKHTFQYSLTSDPYGVHQIIINSIAPGSEILEIGCASGYMTKAFSQKKCRVTGIEIDPKSAKNAKKYCKKLIIGNVEEAKTQRVIRNTKYDYIILADVLEHLRDGRGVLRFCGEHLAAQGTLIVSIPNIAFITERLLHLIGKFEYQESGIRDKTHTHFYTKKSITECLQTSGFKINNLKSIGNFTQLPLYMQTLYPLLGKKDWWRRVEQSISSFWPEGLAVQFLISCRYEKNN